MMTILISSMIIGVRIDNGIHVTWRFHEEFGYREDTVESALSLTLVSIGWPLVASALSAAGAFSIIAFSEIMPVRRFGGVTAMALIVSLISSLLVLPALLVLLARWKGKRIAPQVST